MWKAHLHPKLFAIIAAAMAIGSALIFLTDLWGALTTIKAGLGDMPSVLLPFWIWAPAVLAALAVLGGLFRWRFAQRSSSRFKRLSGTIERARSSVSHYIEVVMIGDDNVLLRIEIERELDALGFQLDKLAIPRPSLTGGSQAAITNWFDYLAALHTFAVDGEIDQARIVARDAS